jgi:hypothetical protein
LTASTKAIADETFRAVEQLIQRHAWLIDHGHADRVPELYTEDARLTGIGPDKIGRRAITQWADQRAAMKERRSRHVQTNIVLEELSPSLIRGTVILTLFRHDGSADAPSAPMLVGEYDDTYALCADGLWRIGERHLTILFGN